MRTKKKEKMTQKRIVYKLEYTDKTHDEISVCNAILVRIGCGVRVRRSLGLGLG